MKINKLKNKIKNTSLREKILLIICLCSFLIYIFTMIATHVLTYAHNKQLYNAIAANMSFSSNTISERLQTIEDLSFLTISSSTSQTALARINASDDALVRSESNRAINSMLSSYYESYRRFGVLGISIYNKKYANSTNHVLPSKMPSEVKEVADKRAEEKHGGVAWTMDHQSGYAILSRQILQIKGFSLDELGKAFIFVDFPRVVEQATNTISSYSNGQTIIFDEEDLLYASPGMSSEEASRFLYTSNDTYKVVRNNGHNYFVVRNTIPGYKFTYINIIPYDDIAHASQITTQIVLLILLLSLILIVPLANKMVHLILDDFDSLVHKMEHFSGNDLELSETKNDYSDRTDEIARLHQQFDSMAVEIQNLIQKNYVNQILNRDAKLQALESQINPHFLYNTLETINWRAKALNDQKISSMTESLGALLRETLSNKESLVSITHEMLLVQYYMNIQNIRFEDRLEFINDFDESSDLSTALIPPLSLQPLLENAIRYGMEEMMDVCEISIHCYHPDEDDIYIDVSNEGSVFDVDLLEKLRTGEAVHHGHGIGLLNINERIQILFGTEYGLSFRNEDEKAIATIHIPYVTDPMTLDEIGRKEIHA